MDSVPCDFIDKVLINLKPRYYCEFANFESPNWRSRATVHEKKIQKYQLELNPCAGGLRYKFSHAVPPGQTGRKLTFDQMLTKDARFHRIHNIEFGWLGAEEDISGVIPLERVPQFMDYLDGFRVEHTMIHGAGTEHQRMTFVDALTTNLKTRVLAVHAESPGWETFLTEQLKNEELEDLEFYSHLAWPTEFGAKIEAFVCRPGFSNLYCSAYRCFDMENIKRIIDYWKNLDKPWPTATIELPGGQLKEEEFATWMSPSKRTGKQFVVKNGLYIAHVSFYPFPGEHKCKLEFKKKVVPQKRAIASTSKGRGGPRRLGGFWRPFRNLL